MKLSIALRTKLIPEFVREPAGNDEGGVVARIWWVATSATGLFTFILTVVLFAIRVPLAPYFTLIHMVFWCSTLLLYSIVRKGIEWIGLTTQMFLVVSSFVFSLLAGDPRVSLGFLLIGLVGPLYALAWPKRSRAVVLLAAYCVAVVTSPLLRPLIPQLSGETPGAGEAIFAISLLACAVSCFLALLFFVQERANALRLLYAEQEKAERLLLNILPQPIADILRKENRVIADYYDGASILFADVVGFTPMAATMQPQEVVELLNDVFSYLDSLVDKYGLEKIKTIGDCYMVASGLPQPCSDHAQRLVAMALEARDHFTNKDSDSAIKRRLSFRMGINSGPVVAGVIGIKRFIYDLWGDTVNTASRMESQGSRGAIQITEETLNLIKDDFICEPKGSIDVKGKGKMKVWYVKEKREKGEEIGVAF
jgi:adenylate cyclase